MHSYFPASRDSNEVVMRRGRARRSSRRGLAAVEFAVVLPLLTTILLGATDFGRFSHSAIAVANAARSGAAYASMNPWNSSTQTAWTAGIRQAVTDELSQTVAFDSTELTVNVTNIVEVGGLRRVSVQVTYPFSTTVTWPFLPSSFDLQQTVVMRTIR
jgi:Flp pilus assembly protein TadG